MVDIKKASDNKIKNFIALNKDDANPSLWVFIPEDISTKINKDRRLSQYIAGDIITIYSDSDLVDFASNPNMEKISIGVTYFLVLSSSLGEDYLLCPIRLASVLDDNEVGKNEVYLGVNDDIDKTMFLYADVGECHYLSKEVINECTNKQSLFLKQYGINRRGTSISQEYFNKVLNQYSKLISGN